MALLDAYDHFFSRPGRFTGSDEAECGLRFDLLRARLEERVARPTGWDEHSLAVPVMAAYLERALSLYVLGFHEACILELHARLAGLMRVLGAAADDDLEALIAAPAVATALAPAGPALAEALRQLARKRRDLRVREDELARSILVDAPARGEASLGVGAIVADSPTSTRVRWGADLHDLCAHAVRACCLLIEASRGGPVAHSTAPRREDAKTR